MAQKNLSEILPKIFPKNLSEKIMASTKKETAKYENNFHLPTYMKKAEITLFVNEDRNLKVNVYAGVNKLNEIICVSKHADTDNYALKLFCIAKGLSYKCDYFMCEDIFKLKINHIKEIIFEDNFLF